MRTSSNFTYVACILIFIYRWEHLQQKAGEQELTIKQQELKIGELQDQSESKNKNNT